MSEELGVTPQGGGEATPWESQTQSTEQPGSSESGENPSQTPEGNGEGSTSKTIPYERFQEVNSKYQELKSNWEAIYPYLESLRQPQAQEVDPNEFQTVEEYNKYIESKMSEREKAIEAKFDARLEAERKLSELKEAYPEMKTDRLFRDFVISKMQQNPGVDAMDVARSVKEYFGQWESKGREATKQEFLSKGAFNGKSEGNAPFAESDEDKALKESIIKAGGRTGIF